MLRENSKSCATRVMILIICAVYLKEQMFNIRIVTCIVMILLGIVFPISGLFMFFKTDWVSKECMMHSYGSLCLWGTP